jgi:DNA-binding MarR family transcriptional regulator
MSRGGDARDAEPRADARQAQPATRESRQTSRNVQAPRPITLPRGTERELVVTRDRAYRLRGAEVQTLAAAGTFRAVSAYDLAEFVYRGDRAQANRDIAHLRAQQLVTTRTNEHDRRHGRSTYVALTQAGRRLLQESDLGHPLTERIGGQRFYQGWVKPAELRHDAALYRMVEMERRALEQGGARVVRVTIDADLKRDVAKALGGGRRATLAQKQEVAEALGLRVVDGRLQIPDVRLEVEHADGRTEERDLELVTEHYRRAHLAAKTGSRCYVVGPDPHIVSRMLDV